MKLALSTIVGLTLVAGSALADTPSTPDQVAQCFSSQASSFMVMRDKAVTSYADVFDASNAEGDAENYLYDKYSDSSVPLDPNDCTIAQNTICKVSKAVSALQQYWNQSSLASNPNVAQCCNLYHNLDPSTIKDGMPLSMSQYPQLSICSVAYDQYISYNGFVNAQQIVSEEIAGMPTQLQACKLTPAC